MRCKSDKMYVFIPEMHQKCQKKVKKRDKMWGGVRFFLKKVAQFVKKQYLCAIFRRNYEKGG